MARLKRLAMAVHEEYLVMDARSRSLTDRGPQLVAVARCELGEQVTAGHRPAQVGVDTEPTADSAGLRTELDWLRGTMARAARETGCRCIAAGAPVLPEDRPPAPPAPSGSAQIPRPAAPADRRAGPVCGCRIHIGPLDRQQALELARHLQPWLPVIVSLAANSPFVYGRDAGCASWRSVRFGRPPVPVRRRNRPDTELHGSGPSAHRPTLEVLVPDANADLDTVVLLAALLRGLTVALLPAVGAGAPPAAPPAPRLRQAYAYAAVHGLEGPGLDPVSGDEVCALLLLDRMVELAAPGLAATGDQELVAGLLRQLRTRGCGASRQRAVRERWGGLGAVVDALALATSGADTSLLTPVA
ncbi:glutamate-cysteine ligase family protein [Streptomyces sp. NPDC046876]|uniref:carboxylate-amine ligase n=1 Tax=Streptomyces sp. NPDC046876 TaxID=3155616 RepID=UPI00340B7B8B